MEEKTTQQENESKEFFTTREVGKMFGVTLPTVITWTEKKKLESFKTLGGHRRITKESVLKFIKEYNLPMPKILQEQKEEASIPEKKDVKKEAAKKPKKAKKGKK